MKPSCVVLAISAVLSSFSPGTRAFPLRLRISRWQTHSWAKKITQPRQHPNPTAGSKSNPCATRIPMQYELEKNQPVYQVAASSRAETLVFATLGVVAIAAVLIAILTL